MKRFSLILTIIMILALSVALVACNGDDEANATKYVVTYDYDFELRVEKLDVLEGAKATELVIPARTGYKFEYWSMNGERYDFDTAVNSDITLKAVWTKLVKVNVVTTDGTKTVYLYPKDSYSLADFSLDTDRLTLVGFYTVEDNVTKPFDVTNSIVDDITIHGDYANKGMTFEAIDDTTARIKKYNGKDKDIVMPNFYEGKRIIEIGFNALASLDDANLPIKSIKFPSDIKTIANGAMSGTVFESLTVPDSVETIGDNAFANSHIARLNFGANSALKSIGEMAFYHTTGLSELKLPSKIETVAFHAFMNCPDLVKVYIPNSVTKLENEIFALSERLEMIFITRNPNLIASNWHYKFLENSGSTQTFPVTESVDAGDYDNYEI